MWTHRLLLSRNLSPAVMELDHASGRVFAAPYAFGIRGKQNHHGGSCYLFEMY